MVVIFVGVIEDWNDGVIEVAMVVELLVDEAVGGLVIVAVGFNVSVAFATVNATSSLLNKQRCDQALLVCERAAG